MYSTIYDYCAAHCKLSVRNLKKKFEYEAMQVDYEYSLV